MNRPIIKEFNGAVLLFYAALFWFGITALYSQTTDWEELIDPEMEEDKTEALIEFFEWRQAHPLDINHASANDWLQFPWIDAATAQAIIAARAGRGGFRRVEDLQSIPALSPAAYLQLLPYMHCPPPRKQRAGVKLEGRHRWARNWPSRLEAAAGDDTRLYQRVRCSWADRFHAAAVFEKDPGESSPADFYGYSGLWRMPWLSGRLCLGAFTLESGRGLAVARGGQWGRGYDPVAGYQSRGMVLRPSASTSENGGQRGAALALEKNDTEVITFFSRAQWDASLEEGEVKTLQWSGLHRNDPELERRGALSASRWGSLLQRRWGANLRLGASWQEGRFSRKIVADSALENLHDFHGRRNWNGGLQAEWNLQGSCLFVEWARSRSGGSAVEAGALLQWKNLNGVAVLRRYGADYHRLLTTSDDGPRNERGHYLALRWGMTQRAQLALSYDYSRNLAPAWRQAMPLVPRHEVTAIVTWQPLAGMTCLHRLRYKSWSLLENVEDRFGNSVKAWRDRALWSALAQMEYQVQRLRWRMRLEYRRFQIGHGGTGLASTPDSSGWMVYQQLALELGRGTHLVGRYVIYDAICYESRIYLYENDLPGALALPSLYGRGCRLFVLLKLSLSRFLSLSAKWSWLPDAEAPGTIRGQKGGTAVAQQALGLQLDWRLPVR